MIASAGAADKAAGVTSARVINTSPLSLVTRTPLTGHSSTHPHQLTGHLTFYRSHPVNDRRPASSAGGSIAPRNVHYRNQGQVATSAGQKQPADPPRDTQCRQRRSLVARCRRHSCSCSCCSTGRRGPSRPTRGVALRRDLAGPRHVGPSPWQRAASRPTGGSGP